MFNFTLHYSDIKDVTGDFFIIREYKVILFCVNRFCKLTGIKIRITRITVLPTDF